jgi:RNA polymerase sigma-70 factor (ECF subfamily)
VKQTVQKSVLSTVAYHTVLKEHIIAAAICSPDPPLSYKLVSSEAEFSKEVRLDSLSDTQLIARCKQVDNAAFDVFIRRHERWIYCRAFALAGNSEDASDIAALTRFQIFKSIGRFHEVITLPAWINRIITNVFIDSKRLARRNQFISLETLGDQSTFARSTCDGARMATPQSYVEEKELGGILTDAISSLPEDVQKVIELFHRQERTYEEIANIMNIPLGTVKSRLNRARRVLRARLAPKLPGLR